MSDLLAQVEASGLAAWVRESPSIWAYPTILTLHSIGLGIVVGASTILDLRLLGLARVLAAADLSGLYTVIWWAFGVNALTGALLFAADATHKSAQPVFFVKLACIAVALAIVVSTRRWAISGLDGGGAARALASVSLLSWLGAIAAGRFMAYL